MPIAVSQAATMLRMASHLRERLYKAIHEKNGIQRYVSRKYFFNIFQRLGLHITGDHFYEIIPNTRFVAAQYQDTPRALLGIDFRLKQCEERALRLVNAYGPEFAGSYQKHGFRENNWYFRGLDALMLYAILRDLRPRKYVEVGQGFSTSISLNALERNAQETGQRPEFISIDPYARFTQDQIPAAVDFRNIRQELQSVDMSPVLENCGFLFIDSSHVHKFGSDVEFEFTQLYPRLPSGTWLHVHDIFSPYDYPKNWIVTEKRFWNEQYLLETFLMFNNAFEVRLPVNVLARQSAEVKNAVKRLTLDPQFQYSGSSFYVLRT
jgi:hypothetical protein